jgi:plastocyanin
MPPSLVIATILTLMTVALSNCCADAQRVDPSIDWTKVNVVTVIMTEYAFSPPHVTVRHGVPTRLHLVNNGTEIHDFTAPDFFKAVDLRDTDVIASSGVGIAVEPHQHKDVDFVVRLPGRFRLTCADHDWAGMTGDIVVE